MIPFEYRTQHLLAGGHILEYRRAGDSHGSRTESALLTRQDGSVKYFYKLSSSGVQQQLQDLHKLEIKIQPSILNGGLEATLPDGTAITPAMLSTGSPNDYKIYLGHIQFADSDSAIRLLRNERIVTEYPTSKDAQIKNDFEKKYLHGECDALAMALSVFADAPIRVAYPAHVRADETIDLGQDFVHAYAFVEGKVWDAKGRRDESKLSTDFKDYLEMVRRPADVRVDVEILEYDNREDFIAFVGVNPCTQRIMEALKEAALHLNLDDDTLRMTMRQLQLESDSRTGTNDAYAELDQPESRSAETNPLTNNDGFRIQSIKSALKEQSSDPSSTPPSKRPKV